MYITVWWSPPLKVLSSCESHIQLPRGHLGHEPAFTWGLAGHLPPQGCGSGCLRCWNGDGGSGGPVFHRLRCKHCTVRPLRYDSVWRCGHYKMKNKKKKENYTSLYLYKSGQLESLCWTAPLKYTSSFWPDWRTGLLNNQHNLSLAVSVYPSEFSQLISIVVISMH